MSWEDTGICWQGRWSVATFLIWTGLSQIDGLLLREVAHVVHSLDLALVLSRTQDLRVFQHDVSIIGDELASDGTRKVKAGYCGDGRLTQH